MSIRFPSVAGMFYPAQEAACRHQVAACLRGAGPLAVQKPVLGGIVPHAGWTFSGPTAGRLFGALAGQSAPETIVLFGAVHSWGVTAASLYAAGSWRTPLGDVAIDAELATAILQANPGLIIDHPEAHASEHSIEVQLPFVQVLFPSARILPLATPPLDSAPEVGRAVGRAVRELGRQAVGIGSSDLTHYGPRYGFAPVGVGERALEWARQNDARLLDGVVAMRASGILAEAEAHQNACGAGAIAAAIAFAAELGATQGVLLQQTTSHEVLPTGRPTDFVGYGAVAFF
jgi:MEMO1 family protein